MASRGRLARFRSLGGWTELDSTAVRRRFFDGKSEGDRRVDLRTEIPHLERPAMGLHDRLAKAQRGIRHCLIGIEVRPYSRTLDANRGDQIGSL